MFAMSYLAVVRSKPKDCVERLREAIAVVKGLWSEGPFTFSGMHYTITEMDGWPKPAIMP
jgi:alkanesulfonate monooxygenase SsuD/methylene tetrahydromethanopterin reductase-like flavin-dependent oxidoreductase (luciferase family)